MSLERVLRNRFTLDLRIANVGLLWANISKWMRTLVPLN